MLADLKFALRSLRKTPGFTFIAVLTLALGLGVNATMLGPVRDMVVRPLVRDREANLAMVYTTREGPRTSYRSFSYREFTTLREAPEVFADATAMLFSTAVFGEPEALRRRLVCFVPENYFSLLGVRPLAGRFFRPEETAPGAARLVAVASHAYWHRLGRPGDLLGREVRVDNQLFTIVGLAPEGFGGLHTSISPEVWLPFGARANLLDPQQTNLNICVSLRPDLTLAAAQSRLPAVDRRMNAAIGGDPRRLVLTVPPRSSLGNSAPVDESFLVPAAATAIALAIAVLLVACLNLANMLLARGASRRREIAVRLSLGATRWRIVRQLLAEGLLLALAGGAAGVLLSVWGSDVLVNTVRATFDRGAFAIAVHPALDLSLIGWMFLLTLAATLGFSLVPALRATRIDLVGDLKQQPGEPAAIGRWNRFFSLRHCLVMAQIALSLMLVFGAALFVRSAAQAIRRDVGFQTAGQLVYNFDSAITGRPADETARRQQALLARATASAGVQRAALASAVPHNFETPNRRVFPIGATGGGSAVDASAAEGLNAVFTAVSAGYFETLGIPLLHGRDFTAAEAAPDGGPPVAIIDDSLARALFGDANPLGRHVLMDQSATAATGAGRQIEVVGVVRSPHEDIVQHTAPRRIYRPLGQTPRPNIYVHVKTAVPAAATAMLDPLRRALLAVEPDAPLVLAQPLAVFVEQHINLNVYRMAAMIFGAFGGIALLLAMVGVYGVKAYAVARRVREIGIRVALGARPADVMRLILGQGLRQTACGVGAGLILAAMSATALSKLLYRSVNPFDPLLLAGTTLMIAAATLLACWVPARRATRVDPLVALRAE